MYKDLLKYLECKECGGDYQVESFKNEGSHVIDGILTCKCGCYVLVIAGIPRFIPYTYIEAHDYFEEYINSYKEKSEHISKIYDDINEERKKEYELKKLKQNTSKYFGFEWDYYKEWGWIPDESVTPDQARYDLFGGLVSHTEMAFESKCLMDSEDLKKGNLILDLGCGNGRFTNQAAKDGATVIGIDLGYGVKSAFKHLRDKEHVHIIQGDIFKLPFKKEIFDVVFSNGVLMHTGNAKKAFLSTVPSIKKGGRFIVHLYHQRTFVYEIIDGTIRFFTTKMSIKANMMFATFMAKIGKVFKMLGLQSKILAVIQLTPSQCHMYDWYSAQIATHHTYDEVSKWYEEAGCKVIKTKRPEKISLFSKPHSMTMKGVKE